MDPTPENLQLWIRPQMLLFWGRFHSTVIPIFPLLFHSSSLLSDVLALGHRGYKGHQINKHNFFSHANFITVAWGGCKRFLCLDAPYGKKIFFSTVLKQKQRKQKPNFTLKERPKDSWHSYFRVSCSTLLILQELPMENMEQKAVFPSGSVSVTEQATMRSRNQGLFCVTLGMCVQDAHLWDLMAPRGASHHGIHTSEMEGAAFAALSQA